LSKRVDWVQRLSRWQGHIADLDEFTHVLQTDVLGKKIYVFTPHGDIKELPEGSTPVDFAYAIHTEVGHRCMGAKVNGKITSLDEKLHNGDIVEILVSRSSKGPSRDWLEFVKTDLARDRIKGYFKKIDRKENIENGRELLNKEIKRLVRKDLGQLPAKEIQRVLKEFGFKDFEELLLKIGEGVLLPTQVARHFFELAPLSGKQSSQASTVVYKPKIKVLGEEGILINLASCCKPVSGDSIVGYITRGKGITVHKANCSNIKKRDSSRLLKVDWVRNFEPIKIPVKISGFDRIGLFADIGLLASRLGINLLDVSSKVFEDKSTVITAVLEIKNTDQLLEFFRKIENIKGVSKIERILP